MLHFRRSAVFAKVVFVTFKPYPAAHALHVVVKAMHQDGWVHRDLSSGNILIDDRGHARVIDLEYAKRARDREVPEFRVVRDPYYENECMLTLF